MVLPKVVVVAVDDSSHARVVWEWTRKLLGGATADTVVWVVQCASAPMAYDVITAEPEWVLGSGGLARQEGDKEAQAKALLNIQQLLTDLPVPGVSIHTAAPVVVGSVAETLEHFISACENQPELVVVGSRGMGAVRRALAGLADVMGLGLGSVSDHLVRRVACPVVVIKPTVGEHPAQKTA